MTVAKEGYFVNYVLSLMNTMTYKEAMKIQAVQLDWYCRNLTKEQADVLRKTIAEKRLEFLENGNVMYTDRLGRKDVFDMDALAKFFLERTGTQNDLAYFGMNENDIKNILTEEQQRQKQ